VRGELVGVPDLERAQLRVVGEMDGEDRAPPLSDDCSTFDRTAEEASVSRIVLYSLMSLDGAVDDPSRYFPETGVRHGPPVFDQELADFEADMTSRQSAVLLGRGMYDEWSRYWPTSDEQPFADFINSVPKYVVTSRPLTGDWAPAEAVGAPLERLVDDLKGRTTGDIGVHGSITLAQSLLRAGLVDELCLGVGRVLDPLGRRLFDGLGELREMQLEQAVATSSGSVWLRYRFHL
jgi:dihydrofolate reductase